MQSICVIQGICISVTQPEPVGKSGTLKAVLTLDVQQYNGKFIDTIPVEIYDGQKEKDKKATDAYRDLLSGDLVQVKGTVELWGPKDGRAIRVVAWEIRNWGSAGGARPPTVNQCLAIGEVVKVGNVVRYTTKVGKRWVERNLLRFWIRADREKHHSSFLELTIFPPWAGEWRARLKRGGIVSVDGKLQSYKGKDGVSGLEWVVTHMEMLPYHRRVGRHAVVADTGVEPQEQLGEEA